MKHLIIPDVHGRRCWTLEQLERFIRQGGMIVCLGDYFDSFDKTVDEQIELFEELCMLKEKYPKNVIMLIGNHEQYGQRFNPNFNKMYSGFQHKFAFRIGDVIDKHQDKLQYAYRYNNYLFTHAGLSHTCLNALICNNEDYPTECNDDLVKLLNYEHPEHWFATFKYNGGRHGFDGILWIRPESLEKDLPKLDMIQVVGHTYQEYGVTITKNVIYCDTHQLITLDI